jgi:hypothetical protein
MATRLELVNDIRALLREDPVPDTTDELSTALLRIITKAARKVLSHNWSFNIRLDGNITFEAPIEPSVPSISAGVSQIIFSGSTTDQATLVSQVSRFFVSDATTYSNTSYRVISSARSGSNITMAFTPGWLDVDITNPTVKIFSTEQMLPATVKKVLSVRHQERPLRLEFVEKHLDFDAVVPRQFDTFRDPEVAYVGANLTDTYTTGGDVVTRPGIMIWPPPAAKTSLQYSYTYLHPALTSDTDSYRGVPESVQDLIVDRSFLYCLTSSIKNDPARAKEVRGDYRLEFAREVQQDVPAFRRLIPRLSGSRRRIRSPWARWDDQEVTL